MTNGRRLLMNIIIWGFLSFSQHVAQLCRTQWYIILPLGTFLFWHGTYFKLLLKNVLSLDGAIKFWYINILFRKCFVNAKI